MSIQIDPRITASEYFDRVATWAYKSAAGVPADKASFKPETSVRSAHEVLQHMVEVNELFAKALSENGAQLTDDDKARISEATASYESALQALQDSAGRVTQAIQNLPEAALLKDGELDRSPASLYKRLEVASVHLTYHWGQIAALQTYWGDQENHFLK